MSEITFREAIRSVLGEEMRANPSIILLGESIATWGGGWKVTLDLAKEFGTRRVLETPVSENIIVSAALGAALAGLWVVAEVYSADFLFAAGSEVLNDIAKWRYQHRWERPIHLVLRMPMGAYGIAAGPEHSQCIEGTLHHTPGLVVVAPSRVVDAAGSMRAAIRRGDPVIFLEHRLLYGTKEEVAGEQLARCVTEIGKGRMARSGTDVTVVAWALMARLAEEAAALVEQDGISVEVVDPITIKPFDMKPVLASVGKTGRLLVVEEAPQTGGVAAEIITRVLEETHASLRSAVRVNMPDIPHPYHPHLEQLAIPSVKQIASKIRGMVVQTVRAS